jgi:hypothetical protein
MMVAADTFAGNPDRMFAGILGFTKTPKGWYHEQNTFIGGTAGARRPVAIDNAFSPSVLSMQVPWGRYLAGTGIQTGSFASATPELSLQEGEMLFKALLKTAEEDHRDDEAIMQRIANIRATEGGTFAANFSKGATEAIQLLLTRGQHWKRQFAADGANDELLQLFKIRKRVIRLVSVGKSPAQAKEIASNDTEYRKWIVKGEDALLGEAVGEYNAMKAMSPGK